jgi:hypothetical protein
MLCFANFGLQTPPNCLSVVSEAKPPKTEANALLNFFLALTTVRLLIAFQLVTKLLARFLIQVLLLRKMRKLIMELIVIGPEGAKF